MVFEDGSESALVFAWRFDVDGVARRMTAAEIPQALAQTDGFVWLHLTVADRRGRDILAAIDMPDDARETLTTGPDRSLLDHEESWIFGQIEDRGRDIDDTSEEESPIRFAASPRLVVTARRRAAQSTYRMRRDLERGRRIANSLDLVEGLLDAVAADLDHRRENEEDALARVEARLMADRHADVSAELGAPRRALAEISRHVSGVLAPLRRFEQQIARLYGVDTPVHELATRSVQRFDEIGRNARADAERARLLQDEATASANILANRHLFVLTVLNSLLLPATLVTGFFGMNTGGLLWGADDPHGTLKAFVTCVIAAGSAAMFMRKRGMFG